MPKSTVQTYRDIEAWRRAMDLCQICIGLAARMPAEHRFGLASQLCRAAVSIPSNIAEGHGRHGSKAFANHCSIANGSLSEVETELEIALRSRLLPEAECRKALALADGVGAVLLPLIRSLRRAARQTQAGG